MFLYKEESYKILGAAFAVHRELGCGFLERVYQDALEYELSARGIPYEREKKIQIMYKGKPLGESYRADFVCYNICNELHGKTVSKENGYYVAHQGNRYYRRKERAFV